MSKGSEIGIKNDKEKTRYDLVPIEVEEGIARVFTYGSKKYGDNNWRLVKPKERFYSAVRRHITEYNKGVWLDSETSLPHLDHAITSLIMFRELSRLEMESKSKVIAEVELTNI